MTIMMIMTVEHPESSVIKTETAVVDIVVVMVIMVIVHKHILFNRIFIQIISEKSL